MRERRAGRDRAVSRIIAVGVALVALLGSAAGAGPQVGDAIDAIDAVGAAQGVPDGLVAHAACGGLLALLEDDGSVLACTHGHDDPPPDGTAAATEDAAPPHTATASPEDGGGPAEGAAAPPTPTAVPCFGDGSSGMRVQAIYAHAAGTPDRHDEVAPRLRAAMAAMTHGLHDAAEAGGGGRHLRFVTDGSCRVVIERVTVTATAAASFPGMSRELRAQGHDDARRRYLVFLDHVEHCGFATLATDPQPGIGNRGNGQRGSYGLALVGERCFRSAERAARTALHELLHTLGAVHDHAPNATGAGHCTDGEDLMCYADASRRRPREVCPTAEPFRIDCRNDDYFHPAPPSGHRLTETWNVADSSFLAGSRYADWVDPVAPELAAEPLEDGVLLTWGAAPTPYVEQLEVLRNGKVIAVMPATARGFEDRTGTVVRPYRYTLRVVDALGHSATSDAVSASRPLRLPALSLTDLLPGEGDRSGGRSGPRALRRAGPDRFATAAEASRQTFSPGVRRAYVAVGEDFPDALSAGAAAAAAGGPVLLTAGTALPSATAEELRRLRPRQVIVVGGTAVIAESVLQRIGELTGAPTRRVAGPDRFATAAGIAADAFPQRTDVVYVATGASFPDALAGVPAAAREGAPLLLVTSEAVPDVTARALARLRASEVVVLGGPQAVGPRVVDELRELTGGAVVRIAGPDRFATAAAIAARAFSGEAEVGHVASGTGFADALAGGPAAAHLGGPLLLAARDELPPPTSASLAELSPDDVVLLGGEAAISARTARAAVEASAR